MTGEALRDWVGLVATLLAIAGAFVGFWKFRNELRKAEKERLEAERDRALTQERDRMAALRLDDVARWAVEAIPVLQRVSLLAGGYPCDAAARDAEIGALGLRASELAEVGRLYFRNDETSGAGAGKPAAYRGYRPLLLDKLILCHEVCRAWPAADPALRERLAAVAAEAARDFVSLIRAEVGRTGTHAPETATAGESDVLARALARLEGAARR